MTGVSYCQKRTNRILFHIFPFLNLINGRLSTKNIMEWILSTAWWRASNASELKVQTWCPVFHFIDKCELLFSFAYNKGWLQRNIWESFHHILSMSDTWIWQSPSLGQKDNHQKSKSKRMEIFFHDLLSGYQFQKRQQKDWIEPSN